MRIQVGRLRYAVSCSSERLFLGRREVLSLCDHHRQALLISPAADPSHLDAAVARTLTTMQRRQRKQPARSASGAGEQAATPRRTTRQLLLTMRRDLAATTDLCLPTFWRRSMARLGRTLGADRVQFFAGPGHQTSLTAHLVWDRSGIIDPRSRHLLAPTDPLLEAAWQGDLGILLPDTAEADALSPLASRMVRQQPAASLLQLAVCNGAGICGAIRVECFSGPRSWTGREIDATRVVGRAIATLGVAAAPL